MSATFPTHLNLFLTPILFKVFIYGAPLKGPAETNHDCVEGASFTQCTRGIVAPSSVKATLKLIPIDNNVHSLLLVVLNNVVFLCGAPL